MNFILHIICSRCGCDNEVSNYSEKKFFEIYKLQNNLYLSFVCENCGTTHPNIPIEIYPKDV